MAVGVVKDAYDLQRFLEAQAGVYVHACAELRAGRKKSHWMWFVFPQIRGLGSSPMAVRYAISSMEEARAYLIHPVLGQRLRECTGIVLGVEGRTVGEIFGYPDDLKFHSCMTLFVRAEEGGGVFGEAIDRYFGGKMDGGTVGVLGGGLKGL
jgi:uncharacterized protein (DUF1810 family)